VLEAAAAGPVPEPESELVFVPPVRFVTDPMGRELSVNAQVDELQMHWPATGSQNGVEQLEGT
jgi:hypothetical protein